MYNCIFSGHCTELNCDNACPILAQTSYLLERNGIPMASPAMHLSKEDLKKYVSILEGAQGKIATYIETTSTNAVAEALTYLAICQNWKGSKLHCTVYNLKLSSYIETLQKSWSTGNDTDLEYIKIWLNTAKVVIVSNIDFVNFKDFQSQTLLNMLQQRNRPELTTIVVSPKLSSLVGDGPFFSRLTEMLSQSKVGNKR